MAFEVNWKRLWLPLLAITITVGVLWFTNRAVTPREPTWDDVVAEAKDGGYRLINTDELRQRYETDPGAFCWWIPVKSGNLLWATSQAQ